MLLARSASYIAAAGRAARRGRVEWPVVLGEVLIASAGALLAYVLALWLLSMALRDVSIVDPAWPVGFVIVA